MKNKEILMDAIGDVDEKLIPEMTRGRSRSRMIRRKTIAGVCAAAIVCAAAVPILLRYRSGVAPIEPTPSQSQVESQAEPTVEPNEKNGNALLLSEADYPQALAYPNENDVDAYGDWLSEKKSKFQKASDYRESFDDFVKSTTGTILNGEEDENAIYSPLSLFMALGMSAEVTGGESRQQILNALSQEDVDTLRTEAKNLWESCYADDGKSKCILANSLWTSDREEYRQETLDTLSENYYASAFTGDPSDDSYSLSLQSWLNEQTDGLLDEYTSDLRFDPAMILTLASTVNYSGTWETPFSVFEADTFHTATKDVTCDYMKTVKSTEYYWGERFSSVSLSLKNSGEMRLILPDEGSEPQELLQDEEALRYLTHYETNDYENHQASLVEIKVPKFDVSNRIDLKSKLKGLGITDVFDVSAADYSPLRDPRSDANGEIYLDKIEQDNRVMIDENGCKAISMTVASSSGGSSGPKETVEFTLDRPFVFELVSESGIPLFIGIVNDPS